MINSTINRIRRNHGLEHATIHVLSEGHKRFSAQGNSDHRGFHLNIYGDVTEEEVAAAVAEAHRRLRAGERHLAVHPNCGTVLVTTALLATLAAQGVFTFEQWRAEKKPSPNPSHREGDQRPRSPARSPMTGYNLAYDHPRPRLESDHRPRVGRAPAQ